MRVCGLYSKVIKAAQAVVSTCFGLTDTLCHFMSGLKATQMNMQPGLVQEFMLYEFKLGQNIMKATKNIS